MNAVTVEDIEIVAAVNDSRVLDDCLRRSPAIQSGQVPLRILTGYARPGEVFNAALNGSSRKIVIFAHQDVYLPAPFISRLLAELNELSRQDANWAVVGAVGADADYQVHGQAWSSGAQKIVGRPCETATRVECLDELLLVVRADIGVQFDPDLPGFHLYGTDIVQTARLSGLASYVVPMQLVHHSKRLANLGGAYKVTYKYLRQKWADRLPVPTMFGGIRRTPIARMRADRYIRSNNGWRKTRPEPTGNPVEIARRLGYEDKTS
ncbi:MAG: glycosyltransferase [Rhodococcus sp. (in: high G+C Gram-positive bacteria)]|uniref:glycosyltransferase n=1 Tax=Rhodococcus sp. TaxID=1831 RepID=UPI003BAE368E